MRWDPGEAERLVRDAGFDTDEDFERACGIRRGRIGELAEHGWDPYAWELYRMSLVLDMSLDELFEATFAAGTYEQGQG